MTIGGERCPSSRRLGARLPLFAHGYYEAPDACPPIPGDCPRDISSVDDDTCDEVEGPPPCRGLNAIPPIVDAEAAEGGNCVQAAANGCCHPVA